MVGRRGWRQQQSLQRWMGWGKQGRQRKQWRHRLSRSVIRIRPKIRDQVVINSENRLKKLLVCKHTTLHTASRSQHGGCK